MQEAKEYARLNSLDKVVQTGSVIVKNGEIIGRGANDSSYHETHECERVKQKIPTGQGYELCEGCHPKNPMPRNKAYKTYIVEGRQERLVISAPKKYNF